jgi:hypothetical protein
MILPSRQNLVGIYQTCNYYHFPSAPVGPEESPEAVAHSLCDNIFSTSSAICLRLVAASHDVSYFRATFDGSYPDASCALCWKTLDALRRVRCWRRGHFAALPYFGVASREEAFSQDMMISLILGELYFEDPASCRRCLRVLRSHRRKYMGEEEERNKERAGLCLPLKNSGR